VAESFSYNAASQVQTKRETMKALDLLTSASKWSQGATARDMDNNVTSFDEDDACKFCLFGAILVAYDESDDTSHISTKEKVMKRVTAELKVLTNDKEMTIPKWNDHRDRNFSEVKRLCERMGI
jgi:hypothetical protein